MFFSWEIRAKLGGRRRKALRYRRKGDTAGIISAPALLKDLPVPRCYWFLLSPVLIGVHTLSSSWYILPTCPPVTPLSLNLLHNPYLIWKALLFPKDEEGAPFSAPHTCVCLSFFHSSNVQMMADATPCTLESTKRLLLLALGSIDVGSFEKKLESSSLGQRASFGCKPSPLWGCGGQVSTKRFPSQRQE